MNMLISLKCYKNIDNQTITPPPPPPPSLSPHTSSNKLKSGVLTLLLAIAVTVLAGCGGGGSTAGTPSTSGLGDNIISVFADSETQATVRAEAADAAGNAPNAGSVTQSSTGNTTTLDSIEVEVSNSNGQLVYKVDRTPAPGEASVTIFDSSDSETNVLHRERDPNEGFSAVNLSKKTADGQQFAAIYTDWTLNTAAIPDDDDTDYLAGGIWVHVPNDTTAINDYAFGAFVDGNDPFTQSNLAAVTGTANYEGEATGVYTNTSEDENIFFDAEASLTADFADGTNLGTIRGTIHDFESEGVVVLGVPVLTLDMANIGSGDSGFFTGDTAITFDGDSYTGRWGGQFYSNPATGATGADTQPGSVAGTFGGATTDNSKSFIGVFGAYKPTP